MNRETRMAVSTTIAPYVVAVALSALLTVFACLSRGDDVSFRGDRDLAFGAAVAESIVAFRDPYYLEDVLPERVARTVRCLGSPDYDARRLAFLLLQEQGDGAMLALQAGLRHRDIEVRSSCERLLIGIGWCPNCRGHGRCPGVPTGTDFDTSPVCPRCRDHGVVVGCNRWRDIPCEHCQLYGRPGHPCRECDGTGWLSPARIEVGTRPARQPGAPSPLGGPSWFWDRIFDPAWDRVTWYYVRGWA